MERPQTRFRPSREGAVHTEAVAAHTEALAVHTEALAVHTEALADEREAGPRSRTPAGERVGTGTAVVEPRSRNHAPAPALAYPATFTSIITPTPSSISDTNRFSAMLDTRWAMRAPNHTPTISSTESAAATVTSIAP